MNPLNHSAPTIALLLSLSACAGYSQTPSPSPETLEHRVDALEKRLDALENIPAIAIALKMAGQPQTAPETPTPNPQTDAPLAVVDWSYSFHDAQYDFDKAHVLATR